MKWFQQTAGIPLIFLILAGGSLCGAESEKALDEIVEAKVAPKEEVKSSSESVTKTEEVPLESGKDSGSVPKEEPIESAPVDEKTAEAAEEAEDKKHEEDPMEARQILGWKEWVKVGTKAEQMRAKLDSGARTSSLHAEDVEEFERDGRSWVRFSMRDPEEEDSKAILIKAPVQRIAKVKNTDGTMERRFVVELGFEMGGRHLREEFTLNDRTGMTCPILIGRNALRHLGYVDCSRVDLAPKKIFK
ncbi:ATP-dependent zinc protease family protein [Roseibacillus persicicus]|uniref:ATP-dependent zinc protease family protein n=1 Tax=Roseibacillus persicicus TaxID=454148 RepID=UPI00280F97B9|nr:ATP-dependent zinc protease [Roseibacillus persicicus]MDQ8190006.1 ATP-dependent zinc protease [Roseibacillus persicicus]